MKKYFFLLNDFSHDLFTGLWICSLLTIYLVQMKLQETMPAPVLHNFAGELGRTFFYLQSASMILIMLTGVLRLYHVKSRAVHTDKRERTILLVGKHIVLGLVFGVGSWLGYAWTFQTIL